MFLAHSSGVSSSMADNWEDWETEEPVVPGAPAPAKQEDAKAKFADEDQGEEEAPKWKANVPAPQEARLCSALPELCSTAAAGGSAATRAPARPPAAAASACVDDTQPSMLRCRLQAKPKKGVAKYDESKGVQRGGQDEGALDDPVAERLRKQRLVEDADYEATQELFGSAGACGGVDWGGAEKCRQSALYCILLACVPPQLFGNPCCCCCTPLQTRTLLACCRPQPGRVCAQDNEGA